MRVLQRYKNIYPEASDIEAKITYATKDWMKDAEVQKHGKLVTSHLHSIVGVLAHYFRVRGHHYLEGAEDTYKEIFSHCLPPEDLKINDWKFIVRSVLHPCGVKALEDYVETHRKSLPGALLLRRDAAPVGTAIVTTTAAALRIMSSEPWWPGLLNLARTPILAILAQDEEIRKNPLEYSALRTLYGYSGEARSLTVASDYGKSLAPMTQGFIDSLPPSAPIKKAKALKASADQNAGRTAAFCAMIKTAREAEADSGDILRYFSSYLPLANGASYSEASKAMVDARAAVKQITDSQIAAKRDLDIEALGKPLKPDPIPTPPPQPDPTVIAKPSGSKPKPTTT